MDSRDAFLIGFVIGAILVIAAVVLTNLPDYSVALATTGRVVEKIEVATGYNSTLHVLKLEVANNRYSYIAVSGQVYGVVIVDVEYKFSGSGDGKSYDCVEERVRE